MQSCLIVHVVNYFHFQTSRHSKQKRADASLDLNGEICIAASNSGWMIRKDGSRNEVFLDCPERDSKQVFTLS